MGINHLSASISEMGGTKTVSQIQTEALKKRFGEADIGPGSYNPKKP
jgi:hypothetical protein